MTKQIMDKVKLLNIAKIACGFYCILLKWIIVMIKNSSRKNCVKQNIKEIKYEQNYI